MTDTTIDLSDLYFHKVPPKRYVTHKLNDPDFNPKYIGVSASRISYSDPNFGGYKEIGYLQEDDEFSRLSLQLNNVKMVATEKTIQDKTMRSIIVKLDMTNEDHRVAVMKMKGIYDHLFRLVADRKADPHIVLAPNVSEDIKNICKKKKISAQDQTRLDAEVKRSFSFNKIVSGLELDSNGEPLPTCEPAIFVNAVIGDKFTTSFIDITKRAWTFNSLRKKLITGNIKFSVGSLSFSGKGVKVKLDANLVYIKSIEKMGAIDSVIAEMEEDVTEEERKRFLDQLKRLDQDSNEETDSPQEGVEDDDEFPGDEPELTFEE